MANDWFTRTTAARAVWRPTAARAVWRPTAARAVWRPTRRWRERLRQRAVRYAENGWTVAPLAVPRDGVCLCVRGDCVDPHLAGPAVRNPVQADAVWTEHPWDIALITDSFDVVDIPPQYGALLNQLLKTTCPTAMAPTPRHWWFFVTPASVPAAQVRAAGGILHSSLCDWVPAPGTATESTGRVRWLVHPHLTGWTPYQRRDPIDLVLPETEDSLTIVRGWGLVRCGGSIGR